MFRRLRIDPYVLALLATARRYLAPGAVIGTIEAGGAGAAPKPAAPKAEVPKSAAGVGTVVNVIDAVPAGQP